MRRDPHDLDEIVENLLNAPAVTYADLVANIWEQIPQAPGLYVISLLGDLSPSDGLTAGRCLQAGMSRKGLRARISADEPKLSDLIQDVLDRGHARDRKDAQDWIRRHCEVRWLSVSEPEHLKWAEHRLLSVVRPIWGS